MSEQVPMAIQNTGMARGASSTGAMIIGFTVRSLSCDLLGSIVGSE
jgi:hypothetical protein